MSRRVIWIILDSVGIGELPDASDFGDEGADTLGHIYETSGNDFSLPNLEKLGLGNIDDVSKYIKKSSNPSGVYCKAAEVSNGKDTTIGHWEMCGIITKKPFPTYPNGFPKDLVKKFIEQTGIKGILGNKVASGTEIIKELGYEHMNTKKPIVYTSSDSVFQIACHDSVFNNEELYELCRKAREILVGEHAVARVIARPFTGEKDNYVRTSARRDFSLEPNRINLLTNLVEKNINVCAIGKIEDIFAGMGVSIAIHTEDNNDGIDKTIECMNKYSNGLIFTNLVEYDSKWGHRRDVKGYAKGLKQFDDKLPLIIENMTEEDLLIINSDHGCDPTFKGTDHTREYIPILIYKKGIDTSNKHIRDSFADIGATVGKYLGVECPNGTSIIDFEE